MKLFLYVALAAVAAAPAQIVDFNGEIRPAIRWLRSSQDPITGQYGDGTEATAAVLRAFAMCPDRYRAADGPFVRRGVDWLVAARHSDGAICDEDAEGDERRRQTRLAAAW